MKRVMVNRLDFQKNIIEDTDPPELLFELVIDGIPLGQLLNTDDNKIPRWYFEKEDLTSYYNDFRDKTDYVIGVCSCGESGCGMLGCEVTKNDDVVEWKNIFNDGYDHAKNLKFRFARKNYDEVMQKIFAIANGFRNGQESSGVKQ